MDRLDFLRALPKVQLHCHLEGCVRRSTFIELARQNGVELFYREPRTFVAQAPALKENPDPYGFATFEEFLLVFAAVARSLRTPDDFDRVAGEYAQDAASEGVVYGELFISPSVWTFFHPELDVRETVSAISQAFRAAHEGGGPEFKLIVDLTRNFGTDAALQTARTAAEMQDLGVIGIGLGGDEARYPARDFAPAFAIAREAGLHCVAHAGESAGSQSIRDAIEVLGAERIGHGIRALEDPSVIELLRARGITLEICLTSNYKTGVITGGAVHPIAKLVRSGVHIALDADDPAIFGTTLSAEYERAQTLLSRDAVLQLAVNAAKASFAPDSQRKELAARITRFAAEELDGQRTG